MNLRRATLAVGAVLAMFGAFAAQAKPVYGPVDDEPAQARTQVDGEIAVSATYAKRDRELVSDYDRSGPGASARIGLAIPADAATFRLEGRAEANKYTTTYGASAEVQVKIAPNVTVSIEASGNKHMLVLESDDADQAAVRAGVEAQLGQTTVEVYGRKRWREYHDFAGGKSDGEQIGGRLRQRFAPYHWLELAGYHERMDDGGLRHGFKRTAVSFDYSQPVARRLRALVGTDYRVWTYQGRTVADNPANPHRHDRLVRPEVGLAWGRLKGLNLRATAGYDFYKSNDPRYSGNGPRARIRVAYRF